MSSYIWRYFSEDIEMIFRKHYTLVNGIMKLCQNISATNVNAAPTPDKEEITIIEESAASKDTPSAEAVKEAIQHEVVKNTSLYALIKAFVYSCASLKIKH